MSFPPVPIYPKGIDSDKTLFLVHNTTETKLRSDNSAWAQEIEIVPVASDKREIWADNGFGNIDGELFYYDSVETNDDGKVYKLKGCSRQLLGKTKFHKKGTWVRSYVVAEHHNQLVDAILQIEDFVGYNIDPRQETLDWRIRNLEALEVIFDDFACPDINFTFNIVEDSPTGGILAEYLIEITPPGTISNFRLDFGDGEFTTTALEGTHRYAVNASVDPVVTVSNDKCQIIQTPIERANPAEPPAPIEEELEIPFPETPDFPDFTFVPCEVPEPNINIPPIVFPCISLSQQIEPLPISVSGADLVLVSQVTITGPDEPVQILHSTVTITVDGEIPPVILIDPPIPPTIVIDPPIPPTIVIVPPQSNITLDLDVATMPRLEVDWGAPPPMEVALNVARAVKTPTMFAVDPDLRNEFGEEFSDLFEASGKISVEYEPVGIPTEIRVIAPELPDNIKLNVDDLPKEILLKAEGVNLPEYIRIFGPEEPIPTVINFAPHNIPDEIDLIYKGDGIPLRIDESSIPKMVLEVSKPIPERIIVDMPKPIPDTIRVQFDPIVLEAPSAIPLVLPKDIGLPVIFPEKMPEVEMVWRGAPIEVKVSLQEAMSKDPDGKKNCVMIVPCNS